MQIEEVSVDDWVDKTLCCLEVSADLCLFFFFYCR